VGAFEIVQRTVNRLEMPEWVTGRVTKMVGTRGSEMGGEDD
jgi:hypothetical protein